MKRLSTLCIAMLCSLFAAAQCTYLAYDAFDYDANIPLNALSGGTGWAAPWNVQSEPVTIPGYQINNGGGSLTFGMLQTIGRYASGGSAYLTAGRRLNVADNGPFANYVAATQNGIGTQTGDTLWVSFMLRKDGNNSQPVWIDLHSDGNIPWYATNPAAQHIGVGYFGATNSDVGGQRHWTLGINGTYYPTSVSISTGTAAFMVLRLIFTPANTQISLYINPATLGNTTPATATLSQNTATPHLIRSAAVYLGDTPGNGAIDEFRLAASYACVAPDNTIAINLPPTALIAATPTQGQVPLVVNFNGGGSTDPESGTLSYLWNFGDGSPTASGIAVAHTYTITGILNASLTVTDDQGLQHTAYQTITLLNAYNTFSCQTSLTSLNMASCGQNNGSLRVNNAANTVFSLTNAANAPMSVSNGNEYHNLAPDVYNLYVSGTNGCTDTLQLHVVTDSTTCAGWQASTCAMDIGTNMSGFADWGVERPMKNLFKHIRPDAIAYTSTCFCWSLPVLGEMVFDENGYPTHIPQTTSAGNNTLIRYVVSSESPTGTNLQTGQQYVLLYDGEGSLTIGGGANIGSSGIGRIQFSISTNQSNYFISITASTLGNPIRNIRLLRLADEFANLQTDPFYQGFIDKIMPFKELRFMDWGATNNNPVSNWQNRSNTDYFTYATPTGVPYEVMIQLANQTQKDVWICIPHAADNDYITQMATLFRDNLNPNLTLYLEYSNEVWNWIFDQSHYNVDNSPPNLNYGRAYAEKAKNTFEIWHSVFGTDRSRVKRVLGIQTTYNYLNEQILSHLKPDEWDYGSPTHYFGLDHGASGNPVLNAASTPQDIINNARNAWYAGIAYFRQDYNNIKLMGKEIATYEGGQHFVGNVFGIPYAYQQAMWDAQYLPEMYALYSEELDTIRAWGCKLATNFSLASPQESVYGSWGALNDIDVQPPYMSTAPKYQALLDHIPNRPTPVISGSNTVCGNTTTTYTVANIAGSTYLWTVTGGTIISGQGTHEISVLWSNGTIGTVQVAQTAP